MVCGNILITGGSRGIGLELIKQLSRTASASKIITTCRDPAKAMELQDATKNNPSVHVLKLDVTEEAAFDGFTNDVERIVGEEGLNLLFNNAGYSPRATKINLVTWKQMTETLAANTIGPLMLTKSLLPLLKTGAKCSKDTTPFSIKKAAIINMSSKLGSMTENGSGGLYPYRASKAALNAVTVSMSLDLKPYNILAVSIHPGWVRTDMGGVNATLTTKESVAEILKLLPSLNEKNNGQFLETNGNQIKW